MEILLEYISIILCIHRVCQKKVKIDKWILGLFVFELSTIFLIEVEKIPAFGKMLIYVVLLLYIRTHVVNSWVAVIKVYGITLVSVTALQLIVYYLLKILHFSLINTRFGGIIINSIIFVIVLLWNKNTFVYISYICKSVKGLIISFIILISLFYFLILYNNNLHMDYAMTIQFLIGTIGISIVSILWISAENENRHKLREVQIYKSYSQEFEYAIRTIRSKQHEFENQINAIRCLQFTIKDHEELLLAQEEYCQKILKNNSINKLLSLNFDPILIGFLYSKISTANEKGIKTKYDICYKKENSNIELYELIELMGILYDNAMEALEKSDDIKYIFIRLVSECNHTCIDIANTSKVYLNSELEKFCEYGYSTKGDKRGIGLSRAKDIIAKQKGTLKIQNKLYETENYICFNICLKNK